MNRIKLKYILRISLGFCLNSGLFINLSLAQVVKYSNEFMSIGIDAKAFGLSNAMVSHVNDITAGYWNPAGLAQIKDDRQIAAMHAEYFAGIAKYDYGAIAAKIDDYSGAAFSIIRFGVDDIPNTTELIDKQGNINYDRITTFSAVDYGFLLSYARKHRSINNLRYGFSGKIIHRKAGDFAKCWGFGMDMGAQYSFKNWNFGIMAKDITTTFNTWTYNLTDEMKEVWTITGNTIPKNSTETTMPKAILGTSNNIKVFPNFYIMPSADFDFTFDGQRNVLISSNVLNIDPHLGIQFNYKHFCFARTGIGNIQKETNENGKRVTTFQPNLGMGIVIKKQLSIDYALTDIGNSSIALYSNVFSLKLFFNKPQKQPN